MNKEENQSLIDSLLALISKEEQKEVYQIIASELLNYSPLSDTQNGQLHYCLEKLKDLKSTKFWMGVIKQIGFQKTIEILIDVGESETAKDKRKCAVGLAKKAGFKKFF